MTTYNFSLLTAFANSAPSNEIKAFPDYDRGLGIAFDQTDGKPEMKGLNGLFSLLTVSLLALKQRGILTWTTGFEYKQGAFAVESSKLYQAKIDNTSKQPSLSQNEWQAWASVSDIDVDTNGNIIKTAKAGGAFTLKVEDASTTIKGVVRAATATEVLNKSNVNAYVTPPNTALIAQSTDLGVGQNWQDVTSSRNLESTYSNGTGKPIQVAITIAGQNNFSPSVLFVNNLEIVRVSNSSQYGQDKNICIVIPSGSTYRLSGSAFSRWTELR